MTRADVQSWLAAFQAQFGEALRTPLDRQRLVLEARTERYPDELIDALTSGSHGSARERMAVYNRQYWFRLLGVLQTEYPLTARLLGMWHFNGYAARFLETEPPRHYDIQRAADGFEAFFERALLETEHPQRVLLSEAVRIDSAYRDVLREKPPRALTIPPAQAARLAQGQLIASPSFRLCVESHALFTLRRTLADDSAEGPLPAPQALAEPQHWLLYTLPTGLRAQRIQALHAALLERLAQLPVQEALAQLEQAASPEERALLLQNAQRWLAESVREGFWSEVRFKD